MKVERKMKDAFRRGQYERMSFLDGFRMEVKD